MQYIHCSQTIMIEFLPCLHGAHNQQVRCSEVFYYVHTHVRTHMQVVVHMYTHHKPYSLFNSYPVCVCTDLG